MTEVPVPGPVPRYELERWRELGLVAGVTARGNRELPFDLGLRGSSTPVGIVMDNWLALLESQSAFQAIVVSRQIHGTEIRWQRVGGTRGIIVQAGVDGHATDLPGVLLAVTVADCVPVYLADPIRRVVALLHAGWRGTGAGILGRAIALLLGTGSRVENLLVHCGVGICGQCYEVGPEVFAACGVPGPVGEKQGLDLRRVLRQQARDAGVVKISTSQFCSAHDAGLFFSHRGSRGADGRMVAYLGLLP